MGCLQPSVLSLQVLLSYSCVLIGEQIPALQNCILVGFPYILEEALRQQVDGVQPCPLQHVPSHEGATAPLLPRTGDLWPTSPVNPDLLFDLPAINLPIVI